MRPGDPDPSLLCQMPQAPGSRMPVHPHAAGVQQDRPAIPAAYGPADGPADRWWQRDKDNLAPLPANPQHPVAVLFTKIADVSASSLENSKAEQAEHGHQCEVMPVRGLAGGGEHGLELQVREAERRRLRRHSGPPDTLGGRVLQHAVDHAGPAEPRDHREPPGHR
jgi:hypothetical protein